MGSRQVRAFSWSAVVPASSAICKGLCTLCVPLSVRHSSWYAVSASFYDVCVLCTPLGLCDVSAVNVSSLENLTLPSIFFRNSLLAFSKSLGQIPICLPPELFAVCSIGWHLGCLGLMVILPIEMNFLLLYSVYRQCGLISQSGTVLSMHRILKQTSAVLHL